MCGRNDFNNKLLAILALFLLAGCQQSVDEVSVRSENVGFTLDEPAAVNIQQPAPAENPINGLKRSGIQPTSLKIPAINLEAQVQHLGKTETGEMAVPDNIEDVSWFSPGYQPGQNGRAVIAGHVDGVDGPAIFWDLSKLQLGDEVVVQNKDKSLTFKVHTMESVPLDLADVSDVFGYTSSPELVMITCSGTYDFERGTREERLIVYASLVEK
ncbi:Peptidase C60 sortase A and B [Planococcus antarcticus DSM 14505]|uniref:Sortase n=1 Tax=Planococcus antarcticus DSM 14505 TaxID=1185653 RepID=A0A1C7DJP4_9BACL|nr:class F sortase [Planococcus antarcticus]ANU11800.1 sortase [Planococcus antarcticus DSM 14505]EIM06340.1 Peptidase C60 sortase A and B [Planococcus antarcticus DSM 14505]